MRHPLRLTLLCLLACVAIYTPACEDDHHDDGDGHHNATPDTSLTDVVYPEDGGDEALKAMAGVQATADPAKSAAFTSPTNGAQLPGATPHRFEWAKPQTGFLLPQPRAPQHEPALRLFGPPAHAHAHGTPINGAGYFVVFSAAGNDRLLRVFTTQTSYQPDDADWAKLKAAQGPIQAVITTATFDNNNVAPSGGPYTSAAISFSISQ